MRLQTDGSKVVEHFGPNLAVRRHCLWVGSGSNHFSRVPACTRRKCFMICPNSASELLNHLYTVGSPAARCVNMHEGCRTIGNTLEAAQLLVWQNRKQVHKRTDVQMRLQTDGWKVADHFGPNLAVRRQCLWVGSGLNDFSHVPAYTRRERFMYRPNSASELGNHLCTVDGPAA